MIQLREETLIGLGLTLRAINAFLRRAVRASFLIEEEIPTICIDRMKMNVHVAAAGSDGGEVLCLCVRICRNGGGECCKSREDCSLDEHLG